MTLAHLYKIISNSIVKDDEGTLRKTIDVIPLEKMSIESTTAFLHKILEICYKNSSKKYIPYLFETWDQTMGPDRLSTLAIMFARREISDELLKFTVKSLPLFTSTEILVEYIDNDQDSNNISILYRIIAVSYTHLTLPTTPYV